MKRLIISLAGLLALCGGGGNASADIIDQTNLPPWEGAATNIIPFNQMGQTFEPGLPTLSGLDIDLLTLNHLGDDVITVEVAHGGQQLAMTSQLVHDGFDGLLHFDLSSPLNVILDDTYTLLVNDTGKTTFGWKYGSDTYPRGTAIMFGQPDGDHDFRFQTYAAAGSVPEPATLLLLGIGLVGYACRRRKLAEA